MMLANSGGVSLTRRRFVVLGAGAGLGCFLPGIASAALRSPAPAPLRLGYLSMPRAGSGQLSAALGVAFGAEEARRLGLERGRQLVLVSATATHAELPRVMAAMARQGVIGFVGNGDGPWSASAAAEAEVRRMVFLNIGCCDDQLRSRCHPATFHVQASNAMYLDALAASLVAGGLRRWCIVAPDAPGAERAAHAVERHGGITVRTAVAAEPDQERIASGLNAQDADVVCLAGGESPRAWRGGSVSGELRPVLWHAGLSGSGAGELNERFSGHFRRPLDSASWAGWMAVTLLWDAIANAQDVSVSAVTAQLREARFDGHKGTDLSFRPWDHQLRQPIYVVGTDGAAMAGDALTDLDAIGNASAETPCGFS